MSKKQHHEHSFTIKGWIQEGSPYLDIQVAHIKGTTIDDAIARFRQMFTKEVTVTDVHRIASRPQE
jgi:hypothetical protein